MSNTEADVLHKLDEFVRMIRMRDQALLDILWGDGSFIMVGSEVGEICRTRQEIAAKLAAIFANKAVFTFDFPRRSVRLVGAVAWVFAEGVLARREPDGSEQSRPYLACCIFEKVGEAWHWRQFFGSEPY